MQNNAVEFISLDKAIQSFTLKYDPYSDFNYTSLFSWNTNNSTGILFLNGNLVIRIPDYISGDNVYSILGHNKIDKSLLELLAITDVLKLVPQVVIDNIKDPSRFEIKEDDDNHDYIYEAQKIASLMGGKLKKKRNKVNKFIADIGNNIEIINTMTLTKRQQDEMLALFDRWTEENHEPADSSKTERIAISRMLSNIPDLNLIITQLRLHGRLVGFSVNELLPNNFAICHFEKASLVHQNIYTFLATQTTTELTKHNVRFINWEQDLGIPGLRKSKESYHPVRLLKKYSVKKSSFSL